MKARAIALTLALSAVGVTAGLAAADAHMGTWKLNEAKSKFVPGAPRNHTVIYEAAGENVKIIVDGVDVDGKPARNEWTGKFDGNNYPVTGDSSVDERSYTRVDERTLTFANKKSGKVTLTGKVEVSADGKTRTVTTTATDSTGKKVTNIGVYDKS